MNLPPPDQSHAPTTSRAFNGQTVSIEGQPCRCLCLGLTEQITYTRPFRCTILHASQIRLTLARTFMSHLHLLSTCIQLFSPQELASYSQFNPQLARSLLPRGFLQHESTVTAHRQSNAKHPNTMMFNCLRCERYSGRDASRGMSHRAVLVETVSSWPFSPQAGDPYNASHTPRRDPLRGWRNARVYLPCPNFYKSTACESYEFLEKGSLSPCHPPSAAPRPQGDFALDSCCRLHYNAVHYAVCTATPESIHRGLNCKSQIPRKLHCNP